MNKLAILLSCVAFFPIVTNAEVTKKPVNTWTCADFLAVDETYKPTAVGIAMATNKKGKESQVIDVKGIETVTPILIQECKKDKKQSFKQKLENEWAKVKHKM